MNLALHYDIGRILQSVNAVTVVGGTCLTKISATVLGASDGRSRPVKVQFHVEHDGPDPIAPTKGRYTTLVLCPPSKMLDFLRKFAFVYGGGHELDTAGFQIGPVPDDFYSVEPKHSVKETKDTLICPVCHHGGTTTVLRFLGQRHVVCPECKSEIPKADAIRLHT